MILYLYGAVSLGFAGIGLFFLKYWRATRDPLFGAFAVSSWLLGLNQTLLAMSAIALEETSWIYLLRLAAFMVIAVAILVKSLQ
jgi:hypothetical protein